jgi:hypothetical protein
MKKFYSVLDLIQDLQKIVEDNPNVDFNKVDVGLNCKYTCSFVEYSGGNLELY